MYTKIRVLKGRQTEETLGTLRVFKVQITIDEKYSNKHKQLILALRAAGLSDFKLKEGARTVIGWMTRDAILHFCGFSGLRARIEMPLPILVQAGWVDGEGYGYKGVLRKNGSTDIKEKLNIKIGKDLEWLDRHGVLKVK